MEEGMAVGRKPGRDSPFLLPQHPDISGGRWGERGRDTEFQLFCGQGPKNNPSGVTGHDQEPQSTQALVEEHTELGSRTRDLGSQEEQPFRPQRFCGKSRE